MNTMSRGRIEFYKKHFPAGTRICLDSMSALSACGGKRYDPRPVPAGTKGTVITVDDIGTLHVEFDNGRCLGICPEVDSFHKISEQTETESISPKMSM